MSIQSCPNELLDLVFQHLVFQSPDNASAVVLSTMLTCSRFCAIAKRHLLRVICLQNVDRVNLFAAYLTQLVNTGAYGKAQYPIEHMAVVREYEGPRGRPLGYQSLEEMAAEIILPFIISTAAPGLRSLVIFGYYCQYMPEPVNGRLVRNIVQSSVRFHKLQSLVLLEQSVVSLYREEEPTSLQHCYPQLTSLHTHFGYTNGAVLSLRTLRALRLRAPDGILTPCSPSPPDPRMVTITIDAPCYMKSFPRGCGVFRQTQEHYRATIEDYHTFIKSNSNSPESCIVITESFFKSPIGSILRAWRDIVQGGSGAGERDGNLQLDE